MHGFRLAAAKQKHASALALITENRDRRTAENRNEYSRRVQAARAKHDRDWEALTGQWYAGLSELNDAWDRIRNECRRLFPDWNVTEYESWPARTWTSSTRKHALRASV